MKKTIARAALGLAALATLTGITACSSPADSEYCKLVKENLTLFNSMSDPTKITADAVTKLREIEAAAPSEIKGSWKTFDDYLQAFTEKDRSKAGDINAVTKAGDDIDAHINSTCKIKLGG